jgi:hypothetical protein
VIDTYDFLPSDVVSLERYGPIPFFSSGVRITHARSDYPSKIIFWYGNPETLIEQIRGVGFSPTAPTSCETKWRGFPVRWTALLLFILGWNGLFLLDAVVPHSSVNRPGPLTLLPLFLAFAVCRGTKTSGRLQQLILSDGHSINEIKAFLSLIQIVSGILLVIFCGAFDHSRFRLARVSCRRDVSAYSHKLADRTSTCFNMKLRRNSGPARLKRSHCPIHCFLTKN